MGKSQKSVKVFHTVREFESEMFPNDAERREQEDEYEHPREAGLRLAEDVLAGLRPKAPRRRNAGKAARA